MYRRIRILWPSGSTESWSRRNQIVLLVIACYVAAAVLGMGLALMQDGGRGVEAPITPRPTRTPGAGGRARTGTPPAHNTPGPLPVVTNPEPFATLPLVESSPVFATPAPAQTLAGGPTRVPFPTPPPATQAPFPTFV